MSNNKNILDLSTQLDLSLIDRFIKLEFENIKQQILYGPGSKDEIWEERKFWLEQKDSSQSFYSWRLNVEDSNSSIKNVIRYVFECVNRNAALKERLLNHVRIVVSENSNKYKYATVEQYLDVVTLIESWLKEILKQLGILIEGEKEVSDKKGNGVKKSFWHIPGYGGEKDAMLNEITVFFNGEDGKNGKIRYKNIKSLLRKYQNTRNSDAHYYKSNVYAKNASSFIKYALYDVVTFVFHLIRHYEFQVRNEGKECIDRDYPVKDILSKFYACVKNANRMTIAFKYKNEASDSKLQIEGVVDATVEEDSDGFSYQTFEIPDRRDKYILRTIQGGKLVSSIEFNPDNYYNGAVVGVTLPTEKIPEFKIDGIINQSTRLMEHTENRKVLEYVLDQFMKSPKMNEEVRKNLRVLFMLDSDEKALENLINKFGEKVDKTVAADDTDSESKMITESEKALLDRNFDKLADDFQNMLADASDSLSNKFEKNMRQLSDSLSKNLSKDLESLKNEILGSLRFEDVMAGQEAILKKIDQINAKLDNWEKNYERIRKNDREEGKQAYENLLSEISKINEKFADSETSSSTVILDAISSKTYDSNEELKRNLHELLEFSQDTNKTTKDTDVRTKRIERRQKISNYVRAIVLCLVVVVVVVILFLKSDYVENTPYFVLEGADYVGNPHAAYYLANKYEKEALDLMNSNWAGLFSDGNYEYENDTILREKIRESTRWFKKAMYNYESRLQKGDTNAIELKRVVDMILFRKGCDYDTKKLLELSTSKILNDRQGYHALVASFAGDSDTRKNVIKDLEYIGDIDDDSYASMLKASFGMRYPEAADEAYKKLKKIARKKSPEGDMAKYLLAERYSEGYYASGKLTASMYNAYNLYDSLIFGLHISSINKVCQDLRYSKKGKHFQKLANLSLLLWDLGQESHVAQMKMFLDNGIYKNDSIRLRMELIESMKKHDSPSKLAGISLDALEKGDSQFAVENINKLIASEDVAFATSPLLLLQILGPYADQIIDFDESLPDSLKSYVQCFIRAVGLKSGFGTSNDRNVADSLMNIAAQGGIMPAKIYQCISKLKSIPENERFFYQVSRKCDLKASVDQNGLTNHETIITRYVHFDNWQSISNGAKKYVEKIKRDIETFADYDSSLYSWMAYICNQLGLQSEQDVWQKKAIENNDLTAVLFSIKRSRDIREKNTETLLNDVRLIENALAHDYGKIKKQERTDAFGYLAQVHAILGNEALSRFYENVFENQFGEPINPSDLKQLLIQQRDLANLYFHKGREKIAYEYFHTYYTNASINKNILSYDMDELNYEYLYYSGTNLKDDGYDVLIIPFNRVTPGSYPMPSDIPFEIL